MSHPTPADESSLSRFFPYREWFALDVRSLALFRVLLAVMVLLDWIDRVPDLHTLFSDEGVFPRQYLVGWHPLSFHLFSGEVWPQYLLSALAFAFALCLLVGYQTPLMCLLSFLMLTSAHGRNPPLMQGGDHLLRALLFWGIFLPLGACASVDAADPARRPKTPVVRSFAAFALIAQLLIVYLFAAAWKWDESWRAEASAVYRSLLNENFVTRLGLLLRENVWLCSVLTHATVYLETLGPVALLLPFHVGLQRLVVIALFIGFHAGLGLAMELGHFPFVCMVAWVALLPPSFWDRLGPQLKLPWADALIERARRWRLFEAAPSQSGGTAPPAWEPPAGPVPSTVLVLCFAYVFMFNLNHFATAKGWPIVPAQFGQLAVVTGLEQGWGLFAPRPTPIAGWSLVIGTRPDGSQVDLLTGQSPPDRSKPPQLASTHWNGRWRRLILNLGDSTQPYLARGYTEWKFREWNRQHPDDPVTSVEVYYTAYPTVGPTEEPPTPKEYLLYRHPPERRPEKK